MIEKFKDKILGLESKKGRVSKVHGKIIKDLDE